MAESLLKMHKHITQRQMLDRLWDWAKTEETRLKELQERVNKVLSDTEERLTQEVSDFRESLTQEVRQGAMAQDRVNRMVFNLVRATLGNWRERKQARKMLMEMIEVKEDS